MAIWENDPIIDSGFVQPANPSLKGWQGDPIVSFASPGDALPRQDYSQLFESKKYSELAQLMADPNTPGIASIFGEDVRDVANNLPESERPLFLNQLNRAVEDRRIQNQGRGYLQGMAESMSYGYEGALSSINQFLGDSSLQPNQIPDITSTGGTLDLGKRTSAQDYAYQSQVQGLRQSTAPEDRSLLQQGVEGAAGMVPDLMASIGATMGGGPSAGFSYWFARTQPEIKNSMVQNGVSEEIADATSNLGSVPIAAIEFIRIGDFAPSIKTRVQTAIQETVANRVKQFAPEAVKRLGKTTAGRATGRFANEYAVQVAQEGAQSIMEASTVTLGKVLQDEGFSSEAIALAKEQFSQAGAEFTQAAISMPFLLGGSRAVNNINRLPDGLRQLANVSQDRIDQWFQKQPKVVENIIKKDGAPSRKEVESLGIKEKLNRQQREQVKTDLEEIAKVNDIDFSEPTAPEGSITFDPNDFETEVVEDLDRFRTERLTALQKSSIQDVNNAVAEYGIELPAGEKQKAVKAEAVADFETKLYEVASSHGMELDELKSLVDKNWQAEQFLRNERPRMEPIQNYVASRRPEGLFRDGLDLPNMEYNELRSLVTRLKERTGTKAKQERNPDIETLRFQALSLLEELDEWPGIDELGDTFDRNDLGWDTSMNPGEFARAEVIQYLRDELEQPQKWSDRFINDVAARYGDNAYYGQMNTLQDQDATQQRGFFGALMKFVDYEPKRKNMSQAERDRAEVLSPEVKTRRDFNRGTQKEGFWSAQKRKWTRHWNQLIKRREYLDMKNDDDRVLRQLLRLTEGRMQSATDDTMNEIIAIVSDMTTDEKALFEDLLDYEDMAAEWETVQNESVFRQGVKSEAQLKKELSGLREKSQNHPAIQEALKRRERIVLPVVEELVNRELLPPEALENPMAYLHRQVMIHQKGSAAFARHLERMGKISLEKKISGTAKDLVEKTFGYQISRRTDKDLSGTEYDYNTNYIESEFDWLTNARHQMIIEDFLNEVDNRLNVMPQLEEQAKRENLINWMGGEDKYRRVMAARQQAKNLDKQFEMKEIDRSDYREARAPLTDFIAKNDPTLPFRQQMAMAIDRARRILELPKDADINWNEEFNRIQREEPDSPLAGPAGMYFKALNEQSQEMRKQLGPVKFVTVEKIVDRDNKFDFYQAHPGNRFYTVLTISEAAAAEMQQAILDQVKVDPSDIKISEQFAVGKNKPMVLPTNLANELNSMEVEGDYSWATTREWKKAVLLAPFRLPGYIVRNKLGDLEAFMQGILGDTSIKSASDGARLAWNFGDYRKKIAKAKAEGKSLSPELKKIDQLMQELIDFDVIGSSRTAADLELSPELKRFARSKRPGLAQKGIDGYNQYIQWASQWTQFSENATRIQAYLDFQNNLAKNRETDEPVNYGASDRGYIDSLRREFGDKHAAAQLARDLLGDYGETTVLIDRMSRNLIPFAKFQGINVEREIRLTINNLKALKEASGKGKLKHAGILLARLIKPAMLYALYNLFFYDEAEDELSAYDRANPHIRLWKRDDGSIAILRNFSTSGDFFEWFGLNSLPSLARAYYYDQIDEATFASEMAKDPANKIFGSISPALKTPFEVIFGQTFFPDMFNPRSAKRDELLAGSVINSEAYKSYKGAITGSGERGRPGVLDPEAILFGVSISDPRRNMLNDTYGYVDRFMKSKGQPTVDYPTSPANDMKRAVQFNDKESFLKSKETYIRNGGDADSFLKSIRNYDPIGRMNNELEKEFMTEYLNQNQARRAEMSRDYVKRIQSTMWNWWAESEKKETGKLSADFSKNIGSKISNIASNHSKPTDAQGRNWDVVNQDTVQWLKDRNVSLNDAIGYLRDYYKSQDISPATRAANLRRARSRLSNNGLK